MLPVRAWRIYYGDGSVADSAVVAWEAAPAEDVQVVVLYHLPAPYRTLVMGQDEYARPGAPEASVKRGRWMTDAAYEALLARVHRTESARSRS